MPKQRINLDEIVASAMQTVDRHGIDELALARVAEDLGVQASALYNHVDGAEGLRQEVASRAAGNLSHALTDAAVARSGADALREVAMAYRTFAAEHPGQYASLLLPVGTSVNGASAPQRQIVEVLSRILESLGILADEAVHGARIIRSAVHGFVTLEASDAFVHDADPDESFRALVDFMVDGFSGRDPRPGTASAGG